MSNTNTVNTNETRRFVGAINDSIRANARLGALSGFLMVVLGVLAIASPFISGIAASTLVAATMVAAGMTTIFFCFKAGSFGSGFTQFFFGGITTLAGTIMLAMPIETMAALTALLLAYFIVDGIYTIYTGIKRKPAEGWGWVVTSGVASLVLGGLLAYQWPDSGAYAIGLLVGIRLLFAGWSVAMLGMVGDDLGEGLDLVADDVHRKVDAAVAREAIREEVRAELKAQDDQNGNAAPQPA
jgi:uncharacterized membrane protein HdeD (DUF308 family)